jgi:plasmid stability protein
VPSIQIKEVPPRVHDILRLRAARAGKSLQEYLLGLLTDEAATPTLDEVLDNAGSQTGGYFTSEQTVSLIRADRDSH